MRRDFSEVSKSVGVSVFQVSQRAAQAQLAIIGHIQAGAEETLHMGVFKPSNLPLYGGVCERIVPGCDCYGDALMFELLDQEPKPDADSRLRAVNITKSGLEIVYSRTCFRGKALPAGRTMTYSQFLQFREVPEDEIVQFVLETRDAGGDGVQEVSVVLTKGAITVRDLLENVSVTVSRK